MKKLLTILIAVISCNVSDAQFVAMIETPEKIEGLCNQQAYYHLFNGLDAQKEASSDLTLAELYERLVAELKLALDFPKFKGSDGVMVSINCKGELVLVESEFKNEELNKRIRDLFTSLKWTAGSLHGKPVDSAILYSIRIKKGQLELNRNVWMN